MIVVDYIDHHSEKSAKQGTVEKKKNSAVIIVIAIVAVGVIDPDDIAIWVGGIVGVNGSES